jgi:hypothetical protein
MNQAAQETEPRDEGLIVRILVPAIDGRPNINSLSAGNDLQSPTDSNLI